MQETSTLVPGSSAAPLSLVTLQAALPPGMYAEHRDGVLLVESDRRNPRLIAVAVALTLLIDGAALGATLLTPLLGALMGMGAVPLTLFTLARILNVRRVKVTGTEVRASSGPVPWFGDTRTLPVTRLKRLFVGRSGNTLFGRPTSALWWECDLGHTGILVDDLPDDDLAGLLATAIGEHLGVDGDDT